MQILCILTYKLVNVLRGENKSEILHAMIIDRVNDSTLTGLFTSEQAKG